MRRDRIDELASELFAAAREERPERGLAERVEHAAALECSADAMVEHSVQHSVRQDEAHAVVPLRREPAPGESGRRESRRRGLMRMSLVAVVLSGGVAVFLLLRSPEGVLMSAERVPSAAPTRSSPPLPGSARQTQEEAVGSDTARTVDDGVAEPAQVAARRRDVEARGEGAREGVDRGALRAIDRGRGSGETPPLRRPSALAAPPTLANELGALRQIRQALRGNDGTAALALLDRYDTGEYGKSLSLEASVLRVEALDAVGRRAEAQALARRFVRENPDSPLAERAQTFIPRTDPVRPSESSSP
jgi:hypothetical protein